MTTKGVHWERHFPSLSTYSEQTIVSHTDWLILFEQEIQAGKHKPDKMPWVDDPRVKGEFYKDICVSTLPQIGEAGKKWLLERPPSPIKTVAQYFKFFYMRPLNRKRFVKEVRAMTMDRQATAEARAQTAKESPKIVDHPKAVNPYFWLYCPFAPSVPPRV